MKKVIYVFSFLLVCISCEKPKSDYQIAQDSETLLNKLEDRYEAEKDTWDDRAKAQFEEECESQYEKVKAGYARFFEKNINDSTAQRIFSTSKWARRLSQEQMEGILAAAGNAFRETELYKMHSERLYNMKTSTPGNPFKDIVSKNPQGNGIKLSDYAGKGKYVLLDFWASWCPPCRAEMPRLVELYNRYKGADFEIVGYSLDKDNEAWKKGIEQLNMTWPQLSDCAFWDSPAVKSYAVQSIPCILLIGPDGKIIERGLTGEDLSGKLKALLK
ncbi:MAG: TlpA family protein disulfide reductase [Dysgonamonadaceae bacterium]|jgi:thiol-disulfide isomerase/thioredoxin|nr:TlpA family protein disulfide reductase [Dysgonamonadaceae bacterium]